MAGVFPATACGELLSVGISEPPDCESACDPGSSASSSAGGGTVQFCNATADCTVGNCVQATVQLNGMPQLVSICH
jgi:hypothetical protein